MIKHITWCLVMLCLNNINYAAECFPALDPTKAQYIIGYGSLINSNSKNRTYEATGPNLPVMVHGFKRAWIERGTEIGFSTTYLGITRQSNASMNAVIFQIPTASHIRDYDARETHYCRLEVYPVNINRLDTPNLPIGQYWIYLTDTKNLALPSSRYPIVQSYVDVFLSGCLEIREKYHLLNYVSECITNTAGWSKYWVNDRLMPRRPFAHEPHAMLIDKLLKEYVGKQFAAIKLE